MKANHIYISELQLQSAPRHRAGIIGIERAIQKKQEDTDKNISQAFEDLSNLMEKVCSSLSSFNFNTPILSVIVVYITHPLNTFSLP